MSRGSNGKDPIYKRKWFWIIVVVVIIGAMGSKESDSTDSTASSEPTEIASTESIAESSTESQTETVIQTDIAVETESSSEIEHASYMQTDSTIEYDGNSYSIIVVDGGNMSGSRSSNVAVDIGYGDRVYWGLTNEYGQLVYALADQITLQDDETEDVNSSGRYYSDEADVPGTEQSDLDKGHVIADSLGGVSNAYNITPQDSTLNRHGDQAYMESVIRDAGGCTNFVATITYPDTSTQIPSNYHFEYILNGENVVDDFANENPEGRTTSESNSTSTVVAEDSEPVEEVTPEVEETTVADNTFDEATELSRIDTNGNGTVTIAEAEAAGYTMPIYSDNWLYKYMIDRDSDGMVGE